MKYDRETYHADDWEKAEILGRRIAWIERAIVIAGIAAGWMLADCAGWFK